MLSFVEEGRSKEGAQKVLDDKTRRLKTTTKRRKLSLPFLKTVTSRNTLEGAHSRLSQSLVKAKRAYEKGNETKCEPSIQSHRHQIYYI